MIKRTRINTPSTRQTVCISISPQNYIVHWHSINLLDINGQSLARIFVDLDDMEIDYCPRNKDITTIKL